MRTEQQEPDGYQFYRQHFWWVMGLAATGIVGTVIMTIQLNVSVARLETQIHGLSQAYSSLTTTMERASGDRYTSTTAAADKLAMDRRFAVLETKLDDQAKLLTELRLWAAARDNKQ